MELEIISLACKWLLALFAVGCLASIHERLARIEKRLTQDKTEKP